jgi:type I restriction enzyme M protein
MASVEVPSELKTFHKIFEKLAYSHDWSRLFDDFLDYIVSYHNLIPGEKLESFSYSKSELKLFWELYQEWIKVMDQQLVTDTDWYDALGTYYESVIISNMSQKYQGQFFTPAEVCNMMAKMNLTAANKQTGLKINDPSCGSGRCLLSMHVLSPGNYYVAADLDLTCVKMTIANFLLHGVVGEVLWMNSLTLEFYGAWKVNEMLNTSIPLPHVRKVEKAELFNFKTSMPVNVVEDGKTLIKQSVVTLDSFMEVSK